MNEAYQSRPLSVTILSERASEYKKLLQDYAGDIAVTHATSDPASINPSQVKVLLADPDLAAQIVPQCDDLQWCQSTWAGNAPLLNLSKRNYRLTGVKGVFGEQMREYVFAYLLYYSRNIEGFAAAQTTDKLPRWDAPVLSTLRGKTLGIMGAGSIAQALIPAAQLFGMRLIGLSRSAKPIAGFDRIFTAQEKNSFARECDFLLNLLPHTQDTINFVDNCLLTKLPPHCVLINAGRGSAIDDDALLAALNENRLQAAVLDVFKQEPLPDDHPFWLHPKVHVTQHTAAKSYPKDIADIFIRNVERFLQNEPLHYEFDFSRGY